MALGISILSSMATQKLLIELVEAAQDASPLRATCTAVGGVDAAKRVRAAERFDIVVLAADVIDQLMAQGHLLAGSRVDLVTSGVVIAVPAGANEPRVTTVEQLMAAVLAASSIGFSTGPSGLHLTQLFERWGITQQIANRLVQAPPGVPVGSLIASGQVSLGFQQRSELMFQSGITLLGPLPAAVQITTTFSAAISTLCDKVTSAQSLLGFFASAPVADIKRRNGMEPA